MGIDNIQPRPTAFIGWLCSDSGEECQRARFIEGKQDLWLTPIRGLLVFGELVKGTTQRFYGPSQRRQCGDTIFRMFVTPELQLRPLRANTGDGMLQRAIANSRPLDWFRTIGAR